MLAAFREQRGEPEYRGLGGSIRFWAEILWDLFRTQRTARWKYRGIGGRAGLETHAGAGSRERREVRMEGWMQDIRFGIRTLIRTPGFTVMAVLTLAIGIGSNAAIFGVVNTVLLQPLPYDDADEVVTIWSSWVGFPKTWVSQAEYQAYATQVSAFEDVTMWFGTNATFTSPENPERVPAAGAMANLPSVLGIRMSAGRWFTEQETIDYSDSPSEVIVLSHEVWRRRYGMDPSVVGRRVEVNGRLREVVGVLPEGFRLTTDYGTPDVSAIFFPYWVPREMPAAYPRGGGSHGMYAAARLRAGVSVEGAKREVDALIARLQAEQGVYPPERQFEALVFAASDDVFGTIRPALLALLGTVAFVLLIACANVANLLLTRSRARQSEMAVRAALGAGRGRLARQMLTESLLLGALGGGLGLALAYGGIELFQALDPGNLPRVDAVTVDGVVLAFSAVVTLLTVLLFGGLPALRMARSDLQRTLSQRGEGGVGRSGWQGTLVAAEMALAVVLVIGAGLMVRTFEKLSAIDLGFDGAGVVTLAVSLPTTTYGSAEEMVTFHDEAMRRMAEVPGIQATSAVRLLPLASQIGDWGIRIENYVRPEGLPMNGDWQFAAPDYFEIMGIPMVRGRSFESMDDAQGVGVAIVNEAWVRHFFPNGEDPIGRRMAMRTGQDEPSWLTIVGVAGDVRHNGVTAEIKRKFYVPLAQWNLASGNLPTSARYVVQTAGDPTAMVAPLRGVVRDLDPTLAVAEVQTVDDIRSSALAQPRFTVVLMGAFSLVAVLLAMIGIYGVISYGVSQRTREIGLRVALGAERGQVVGLMLRQGLAMVGVGLGVGVAVALGITRFVESLLYEVDAQDPLTFLGVGLGFGFVALVATWLPSRRAAGVDPIHALKAD